MSATSDDILGFWFGADIGDQTRLKQRYECWFSSDPAFDAEIAERFGATVADAVAGDLSIWRATPRGSLALIITLDQFSRNIHRGRAAAFAGDAIALDICRTGIRDRIDRQLAPVERAFFYMPLEHAEDLAAQRESVAAFERLVEDSADNFVELAHKNLNYAIEHLGLIEKFGRFPHRNTILGRASTAAEKAHLEAAASRFGQG